MHTQQDHHSPREMKARVTRWSNQLNKLSDEIADH
jgi:hypothetical protein